MPKGKSRKIWALFISGYEDQNPSNAALRVHAPSELSIGQRKGHQANTANDRRDPFQTAFKDAQKE